MLQSVTKGELFDSRQEREAVAVADDNLEEAKSLDEIQNSESVDLSGPKAVGQHKVMVTGELLRGLKAEIGDELVLVVQDKNNMQQAVVATISGVIDFGLPNMQSRIIWMDFKSLRESLHLADEVSEVAVTLAPNTNLETMKTKLQNVVGPSLVSETYLEISGFFKDVMGLQNAIFNVVIFIVFSIVIAAIVNTSLMTVMERTREIGTLMALGYKRKHILFLFLSESACIGLLGGVTGVMVVTTLLSILSHAGITFALPGQTLKTVLYPAVSFAFLMFVLTLAIVSALVAAFIPSYRASHLKPVEALAKS